MPLAVTITPGAVTTLGYVPRLAPMAAAKLVPIVPGATTVVTAPELPGFALTIPAGVQIIGWDGAANTRIGVTAVPVDRSPLPPFPAHLTATRIYSVSFGKFGGGTPTGPVVVDMANDVGARPGETVELWYFNDAPDGSAPNRWEPYGTATVSADGQRVLTDVNPATGQRYGVPRFCCGGVTQAKAATPPAVVTWATVAAYVQSLTPGPNETVWVERCASSAEKDCYVVWLRRASTVAHTYKAYWRMPTQSFVPLTPSGTPQSVWLIPGDGTSTPVLTPVTGTVYGGTYYLCWTDASHTQTRACEPGDGYFAQRGTANAGWYREIETTTCAGQASGLQADYPPFEAGQNGVSLTERVWIGGGYLSGRTAGQCRSLDVFLKKFEVARGGVCLVNTTVATPVGAGTDRNVAVLEASSCGCLPDGHLSHSRSDGRTYLRHGIGDPGTYPGSAGAVATSGGTNLPGTPVSCTTTLAARPGSGGRSGGPSDGGKPAGDPVDTATGFFYVTKTDLVLPGVVPLAITRTYRTTLMHDGPFGVGTDWAWDRYLVAPPNESAEALVLYSPGNRQDVFARQGDGTFVNGTSPALRGAVVTADASGRTLRFKDGREWRFDATGRLTLERDRHGTEVTLTRDAAGRVTAITTGGRGFTVTYETPDARIAAVTDPLGRQVRYTYDDAGRLATVTDPAQGATSYTYDDAHRMVTLTDARGITFLTNTYDGAGRVATQTQADGGAWTFSYVTAGDAVSETTVTDPRGAATRYRFNGAGYLISETDALGHGTTFEREPGTNLVRATTDALWRTTQFAYDAQGNVTAITDPAGHMTTFTYDPVFNRVLTSTDALEQTTTFEYDGQGNLTAVVDPLTHRTTMTYNAAGQPTSVTDPLSNATTFTYDAHGNLAAVTDPLGTTTQREYDAGARLIRQLDPRTRATTFQYNALNQVRAITDALGGVTGFTYDGNGNLLTVTDAVNNVTRYTHDVIDRLASRTDAAGATETFVYDGNGNLTQHIDRKGQAATFGYDPLNRRTSATYVDAVVSYVYDATGRLLEATDSAGGSIVNQYDPLDRLIAQTQPFGVISYQYDALGRRRRMDAPGVAPVDYAYDAASRLRSITQAPLSPVTIDYDAAGRRTKLTLPNAVSTEYQYDVASRLTALIYRNATGQLGDLTYRYDAAGNRIGVGGSFARTLLPDPVATATYGPGNRQLQFGDQTMTFDANGNTTSIIGPSGTTTLTWDARNRLSALDEPGTSATFTYSAGGRNTKTVNGRLTRYLHDGADVIQQLDDTGSTGYLRPLAIDELLTLTGPQGTFVPLADALGTTMALMDGSGVTSASYTYAPFGATESTAPTFTNPFQFTGRENDGPLYYYRARYYYPGLQRFIAEDPLEYDGGDVNLYAYVANNPVRWRDPLGLTWTTNARFLADFLTGGGAATRQYGSAAIETTEMQQSIAAQKMRAAFAKGGCKGVSGFAYGTGEAYWDTVANPRTADWSSTAAQVGGFADATVVNNGNGTITFTIPNQAGARSFFYHAVPNAPWTNGPLRTVSQTFQWTEPAPLGCRKN